MTNTHTTSTGESVSDAPDAAYICATCGQAYPTETLLIHHRGIRHPDDLSETELEQYHEAYAEEEATLRRFRIIALGGIVLLYFGFLFMYAVFAL
ncbi:hypothetical protein SAMN04487950_2484 [Halogranum rubrum]|uniref:C2H2-type domain-containing protein n=2 Tax=Halogranum rubrum TaxID=553466 RepID=A0A1I4EZG0_9EURY|nr:MULTISPECIES: hypothetical protein [Halogranum]EJN60130.1 hypothetical protein HSB1_07330 [Halogranum salarium B-1]SFL10679.1 hypothetical protein SAMN04487950_2484 [Halogranum rubrum]